MSDEDFKFIGSINLNRADSREARELAVRIETALKLGYRVEASLMELKAGMDINYWFPSVSFRAFPPPRISNHRGE